MVEQYSVTIVGVAPNWVSLETSTVQLFPGTEQRFTITIRPGDDAVSVDHHLTVTVTDSGGATSSHQLSVHVEPDLAASRHGDSRGLGSDITPSEDDRKLANRDTNPAAVASNDGRMCSCPPVARTRHMSTNCVLGCDVAVSPSGLTARLTTARDGDQW